jgi:hypothetical protein
LGGRDTFLKEENMAQRSYCRNDLSLEKGSSALSEVRELQADLRALGYLQQGIDGRFGGGTEKAVQGLQYDLLHNDGKSREGDGNAPVRVMDFNQGRVAEISGTVDYNLALCITDMLDDPHFPVLPKADDPRHENAKVLELLKSLPSKEVPIPFLKAIFKQESDLKHFNEPRGNDQDTYITTGLDRGEHDDCIITSRGYGVGQYTLFHHPPTNEEIADFMLDVEKNVSKAIWELLEKFNHFIIGSTAGTRADDRINEYGHGLLRTCPYTPDDSRFMRDCKACMVNAGQQDVTVGVTRLFEKTSDVFKATRYYSTGYEAVPIRRNIPCDWPYAARRYNGSGTDSYHYQAIILKNVLVLE